VSNPALFSSLTLSAAGQNVTVTSPTANTLFNFTPIALPAGGSVTFMLNAAILGSAAKLDGRITYAGLGVALPLENRATLPLLAALLLIGLALAPLPAARRRQIALGAILAIAMAAAELGCGGGTNRRLIGSVQTATCQRSLFIRRDGWCQRSADAGQHDSYPLSR
jgi:hypothetical protein